MPRSEPKSIRRLLAQRGALTVSVALCAFLFFQLVGVVRKSADTDATIDLLRAEHVRLSEEKKKREHIRALLETDYFAEREARTKLGYKKNGERAVIITEEESALLAPSDTTHNAGTAAPSSRAVARGNAAVAPENYAERWWRFFFGR